MVFVRDRDGSARRQQDVECAIREAGGELRIVGGLAIERLESWLLSLDGQHGAEDLPHPEQQLPGHVPVKDTVAYVAIVERAGLDRLPADAHSLRTWIERAKAALGAGPR